MDFLEIKSENSFQEQNSQSECTSPSDLSTNESFRGRILNGHIKLKEKRGRSRVWNIFATLVDENGDEIEHLVGCRSCFNVYKYANSTSNLVKHKCYISYEAKENGQDIKVDSETRSKLNEAATQWLITNCRHFNILEDAGLRNLASIFLTIGATVGENVNIEDIMPKLPALEKNFNELYEIRRQKIAQELKKVRSNNCYSITCNLWEDSYIKRSFIAISLHYVQQSAMISHLIAVAPLDSNSNTANRIEEQVKKCLLNFGCNLEQDKPIIVTPKDDELATAFKNYQHINCIVNELNSTIDVIFRVVPELRNMLTNCKQLIKDCYSFSSSKQPILYYLNTVKANWHDLADLLTNNLKNSIDIDKVKAIASILQSFEQTILALEKENTPTMHLVIPHFHKLKKLCTVIDKKDISLVNEFKTNLKLHLDSIATKFISKYHKIALFLFPPTKKLVLFDDREKRSTIDECKLMMQEYYVETDSSRKKIKLDIEYCGDGIFSDFIEQTSSYTINDTINNEINEYLAIKITLSEVFDVLNWWKANQVMFPLLYRVSCKILGTPATTVPSDRAIQQVRNLLSANQTAVPCNDDVINQIIFLNNNNK